MSDHWRTKPLRRVVVATLVLRGRITSSPKNIAYIQSSSFALSTGRASLYSHCTLVYSSHPLEIGNCPLLDMSRSWRALTPRMSDYDAIHIHHGASPTCIPPRNIPPALTNLPKTLRLRVDFLLAFSLLRYSSGAAFSRCKYREVFIVSDVSKDTTGGEPA
jgi:hypothetical protein